jgi:hypothetical protein
MSARDMNEQTNEGEIHSIPRNWLRVSTPFASSVTCRFVFSSFPCASNSSKEDKVDIAAFHTTERGQYSLLCLKAVKKQPNGNAIWQLCGYMSEVFDSKLISESHDISFGPTIDYAKFNLYGFL